MAVFRWTLLMAGVFLFSYVNAQNRFSLGLGTVYGGAIPTEKIEDAEGKAGFGAMLDLAYWIPLGQNTSLLPGISFELRHFGYSATERKDTLVLVDVMGNPANIPTYYNAAIDGKVSSGGLSFNLMSEYSLFKRSSLVAGIYSTLFLSKNDRVDINIRIGEGGLLPDVDSAYSNRASLRNFEHGILLGGKIYFSDNVSLGISGARSLSGLYTTSDIKNSKGEDIRFYSTYARLSLNWYF
jgi:hypothetical protein